MTGAHVVIVFMAGMFVGVIWTAIIALCIAGRDRLNGAAGEGEQ